jgi:glutamyl-tRNA reductase
MEIQELIRDYFENPYTNKFEYLEEMNRFLETYNHPKLNQEDINHLNRFITQKEIEAAMKSLPKNKVQDTMDSLLNSIRHLKKN